jgi:hypothetical protein
VAGREETLLFIVDVQVRNAQALAALRQEMDQALASKAQQYQSLEQAARNAADGHASLADEIDRANAAAASPMQPPAAVQGTPASTFAGSRSNRQIGSRSNPEIVAMESGQAAGLGSLAADAANNAQAATTTNTQGPVAAAPTVDAPTLQDAVRRGTQAGNAAEDDRMLATFQAARNLHSNPTGAPMVFDQAALDLLKAAEAAPSGRTLSSGETAQRLGVSTAQARDMAATGQLPGARKENGQWVIPEEAVASSGGAGGRGGGRVPPVALGGSGGGSFFGGRPGGRSSGGGSRSFWSPWSGLRTEGDEGSPFTFANLFKGDEGRGGAFGLPGFGSVGSLAGLGLEHWMLTGAGLTASAGSALGGAGLLGTAGLSQMAVGGGADALINHMALSQVAGVASNYTALQTAIAEYGAGSKQATAAQNLLTYSIKQAGPEATKTAYDYLALKQQFDATAKGAEDQSTKIMDQALGLAKTYVPAVTAAAQHNLGIINTGLKPLFSWLEGPEGMGIFNTLEDKFAQDLPTSIHALDMGIEDFLRLMQAASQYTGGLSRDLDNFFTGKSKESTAQYDEEVQKLVGDLKEWEGLVKLLAEDAGGIFKQDAGTANSIVGELTQMLSKLHAWETSTTGEVSLQNIFYVHKQEIDEILQVLPTLLKGYGNFYLDVAPPLVKALTAVVGGFVDMANAIEKIPGGADFLGLLIVMQKLGVLSAGVKAAGAAFGFLATEEKAAGGSSALGMLGAGGVAKKAAGGAAVVEGAEGAGTGLLAAGGITGFIAKYLGGNAIKGGVEKVGLNAAVGAGELTGSDAIATGLAGGAAALAPIIGTIIPLAAAGLAAYGGYKFISDVFKSGPVTTAYSSNGLAQLLQQKGSAALGTTANPGQATNPYPMSGARAGYAPLSTPSKTTVGDLSSTKQAQQTLESFLGTMSNQAQVAKMGAQQLQGMVNEGNALAQMFPKDATAIDKFTDRAQQDLGSLQGTMKLLTDRWNADGSAGLKTLVSVFAANTELIANKMGLSSAAGESAMHKNIQQMVTDLTKGMADGKISVTSGMAEINSVLKNGMQNNAVSWQKSISDMLSVFSTLRSKGKIGAAQYNSDVNGELVQGAQDLRSQMLTQYSQMATEDKQKFAQGNDGMVVTQQGLEKQLAGLHAQALKNASSADVIWLTELESALKAAGRLTSQEMSAIGSAIGAAAANASKSAVAFSNVSHRLSTPGHAVGGKVTSPTYMVGEEAPAHPEFVLATNPAYRSRNLDLWTQAGHALGVKGFATGGSTETVVQLPAWLTKQFADVTHVGIPSWLPKPGASLNQQLNTLNTGLGSSLSSSVETLIGKVLTKVLTQLTASFQNEQTKAGNQSTLTSTLQTMNPGTKTGLSGTALKATGLTSKQISTLMGGGPASYGVLATLDQQQASEYQSQATKLESAYKDAVKSHNTKLQSSLLSQLSSVDDAMESAISAGQQALVAQIQAQGQAYDTTAQNYGSGNSLTSTIENLAPGTSLADLGITANVASALGLPSNWASLEGTGNTYLQNQLTTNGSLTPAQIAAAGTGNSALNGSLQTEISGYETELNYDEGSYGSLSGTAQSQMMSTISGLIGTIAGLQSTMQDNNSALTGLTTATNANTAAVSTNTPVTGTVAYSYQGQQYLASDSVIGLGVGS